jgi:vacuolar-type H+-ATPase subunit F/Vma7
MDDLNKSAIIGRRDFVQIFRAVGFDTYYTDAHETADEILTRIAPDYKIILTTETVSYVNDTPFPCVLQFSGVAK